MEINKVVCDIEINKVAYTIARCENRIWSKFVKLCRKSTCEKSSCNKLHASDSRNAMFEINKVVYDIELDEVVKIACDRNL